MDRRSARRGRTGWRTKQRKSPGIPSLFLHDALIGGNGGGRRRIPAARAFVKNAPIILPDEAGASPEAENEKVTGKALSRKIRSSTARVTSQPDAHRQRGGQHFGSPDAAACAPGVRTERPDFISRPPFFNLSSSNLPYNGAAGSRRGSPLREKQETGPPVLRRPSEKHGGIQNETLFCMDSCHGPRGVPGDLRACGGRKRGQAAPGRRLRGRHDARDAA